MMSAAFLKATGVKPLGQGRYGCRFSAPWYQGRGAYGGVVGGVLLRAMEQELGEEGRPVRTLHLQFCAPALEGAAEARVKVERRGKQVSFVTARVESEAGLVALGSATFGVSRAGGPGYEDVTMPRVPGVGEVELVPEDVPMPEFCRFFEYRYCVGAPYAGMEVAEVAGWLRPREPVELDGPLCVGMMDAYPPSVLSKLEEVKPAASVDLTLDFYQPLRRGRPDAHYLRTGRSRMAGGGFTDDQQELWTEDGRLLARCRQLVAVFS